MLAQDTPQVRIWECDLRRAAANDLEQVALSAPDVIDIRKVVRFHLGTIRGIGDPDSYIKREQPQSSIPPAKINISLSMPFDKLPEDVQNQILPMLGLHRLLKKFVSIVF